MKGDVSITSEYSPDDDQISRDRLRRFVIATVTATFVVFLLGWFTSLRVFAASSLVVVGSISFLPLVLIVLGVCITLVWIMMSFASALVGGGALGYEHTGLYLSVFGFRVFRKYYDWFTRRERVSLWGGLIGSVLGVTILAGLLLFYVIPRESSTAVLLVEVGERLQAYQVENDEFPTPDTSGSLLWEQLATDSFLPIQTGAIQDSFGHDLNYIVEAFDQQLYMSFGLFTDENPKVFRPGSFERFTISSRGQSSLDHNDDITHTGVSEKAEPITTDTIRGALTQLVFQKAKASTTDRLKALRILREKKDSP